MAEAKFSYQKAIAHGWAMTKKYLNSILVIIFIYIVFNAASGALEYFAGSNKIQRNDINNVFENPAQGDQFYQYLQQAGYINQHGNVQDKLQQISTQNDLTLPLEFEDQRDGIYNFLNSYRYRLPFPRPVFYGLTLIFWVVGTLISIGLIRACLRMSRDEPPSIDELFSNWHLFIPYLLGSIYYGLAVMGGFVLLIVPGFIFMIMFQMYSYLIIDKELGPIESLKRSRVITKGSRGRLAIFGLLLLLLNIGGLLCLVVGVLITVPISSIAMAYVYDRLEMAPDVNG